MCAGHPHCWVEAESAGTAPAPQAQAPALCFCAQWLQQIEVTESALQQKMLDLENEKVPRGEGSGLVGEAAGRAVTVGPWPLY